MNAYDARQDFEIIKVVNETKVSALSVPAVHVAEELADKERFGGRAGEFERCCMCNDRREE